MNRMYEYGKLVVAVALVPASAGSVLTTASASASSTAAGFMLSVTLVRPTTRLHLLTAPREPVTTLPGWCDGSQASETPRK